MIPAGLLVLALLALLVYMCCRGKKTDAYAATPAEEDATANTKYENGVDEIQEGDLASPVSEEEGVNASQLVFQRTAESAPKTPLTHDGAPSELNPLSYYDARGPSFAPTKSGDGGAYNPDRVGSFFRLFLSSCHPVPYTLTPFLARQRRREHRSRRCPLTPSGMPCSNRSCRHRTSDTRRVPTPIIPPTMRHPRRCTHRRLQSRCTAAGAANSRHRHRPPSASPPTELVCIL